MSNLSTVQETIYRQVVALGVSMRGITLVKDGDNYLKFVKGNFSVGVTYVPGRDTYTVRVYKFDRKTFLPVLDRTFEDVYADSLDRMFQVKK